VIICENESQEKIPKEKTHFKRVLFKVNIATKSVNLQGLSLWTPVWQFLATGVIPCDTHQCVNLEIWGQVHFISMWDLKIESCQESIALKIGKETVQSFIAEIEGN
jgi:hypothetical protein